MTALRIVSAANDNSCWAWAALRLAPAEASVPLASDRTADSQFEYGSISENSCDTGYDSLTRNNFSGRGSNIVQASSISGGVHFHYAEESELSDVRPWLKSMWNLAADSGASVEMRYLHTPPDNRMDNYLLIRTTAATCGGAVDSAHQLQAGLATMPAHTQATPVADEMELRRILDPFEPHPDGLVEIHKRMTGSPLIRGDTKRHWLVVVTPFHRGDHAWEPMIDRLVHLPSRVLLSVGLYPYRIGRGFQAHLGAYATEVSRLARPGGSPTGVWSVPRPADPFAVQAEPVVAEAVRRYTTSAFIVRISLAAELPIPDLVAEIVADTMSPARPDVGLAGAAPKVVRPRLADLATARRNITALNFERLIVGYRQGLPVDAISEVESQLAAIVDVDEASAIFRLPDVGRGSSPQPGPFDRGIQPHTSE